MTYEHLKEYISIILDMEKNLYVQKKTLEYMYNKRNSLGIKRDIEVPHCDKAKTDYVEYMLRVGLVFAAIGFVVGLFARWGEFWENSGIFAVILAPLFGVFIALIVGLASAVVIGPFVAMGVSKKEQSEYDLYYEKRLQEYDHQKKNDDNRVRKEIILRGKIQQDIDLLESKYNESNKRLDKFYSYNIINEKYRHDIVAIASFYQYLDEKRTYSLEYDRKTADKGAYNIYNEEAQRGIIISQLNQILSKLDRVLENQQVIQTALRDANSKINYLSSNINKMSNTMEAAIQEQTAIQMYNAERTQAELRFMNTMNIIYNWH